MKCQYEGDFETHLTVRVQRLQDHDTGLAALQGLAQAHGLKCLHIVLPRGACPSQPMLTRRARGRLDDQLDAALRLSSMLAVAGFEVLRTKVEASPRNQGIPQDDEQALPGHYFESHVKLLLDSAADVPLLTARVEAHAAHLSRNALRTRPEGLHERFVTQRCRGGLRQTRVRLDVLLSALAPLGHELLAAETEYVVHDSNLAVDDGWLSPDPCRPP